MYSKMRSDLIQPHAEETANSETNQSINRLKRLHTLSYDDYSCHSFSPPDAKITKLIGNGFPNNRLSPNGEFKQKDNSGSECGIEETGGFIDNSLNEREVVIERRLNTQYQGDHVQKLHRTSPTNQTGHSSLTEHSPQPECSKCQPEQALRRVLKKFNVCSLETGATWIEKELSVKELRQIIPLLIMRAFDSKCIPSLKKVKGIWDSPPIGWPPDLPYCDPNNGNRTFGKPRKNMLIKTLLFLLEKYKLQGKDVQNDSSYVPSSPVPDKIQVDQKCVCCQDAKVYTNVSSPSDVVQKAKQMPSLISISTLSHLNRIALITNHFDNSKPSTSTKPLNNFHLSDTSSHKHETRITNSESPIHVKKQTPGHLRSYSWDYGDYQNCENIRTRHLSLSDNMKMELYDSGSGGMLSRKEKYSSITEICNVTGSSESLSNTSSHESSQVTKTKDITKLDTFSPMNPPSNSPKVSSTSSIPPPDGSVDNLSVRSSSLCSEESDYPSVGKDPIWTVYTRIAEKVHYIHWKGWLQLDHKKLLYTILETFQTMSSNVKKGCEEIFLEQAHHFDLTLDMTILKKNMPEHHVFRWKNFLSNPLH